MHQNAKRMKTTCSDIMSDNLNQSSWRFRSYRYRRDLSGFTFMANDKHWDGICVLKNVEETCAILTHILRVGSRYRATSLRNEISPRSYQHVNSSHNFDEMPVRQVLGWKIIIR